MINYSLLLSIFLISVINPRLSLRKIGEYDDGKPYENLIVEGKYAYLTGGSSGVTIVDISKIRNPERISMIQSLDYSHSLDIQGFRLYLADGGAGVRIFDIRNRENPIQIGFIQNSFAAIDIDVCGDYCYIARGAGGVEIIDISRGEFPRKVTSWSDSANPVNRVKAVDDYLYAGSNRGVLIFKITDTDTLKKPLSIVGIDSINSINTNGQWLFASGSRNRLLAVNVLNKDYLYPRQIISNITDVEDLKMSGYNLFIPRGDFGLKILNVLNPLNPIKVNESLLDDGALAVDVVGNYLFSTGQFGGLKIFKIELD